MTMQLAKGVRDFPPEDKIARQKLVDSLRTIFERFGFVPLETPIIERWETLTAKGGAGEESDAYKEIFRFSDQGDRKLGLRFDLTVPMSRFVAMNPNLKMPFKRYQIGRVYRDGPIKTGRYREFWQCDTDIVGCKEMTADAECINVTRKVFETLNLDVNIFVSNRKLLSALVEKAGISVELVESVLVSVDKLDKYGEKGVIEDMMNKGFDKEEAENVLKFINVQGSNDEKLKKLDTIVPGNEGLNEMKVLLSFLPYDNVVFLPSLARGLSYYTGPVWEVYSKKKELNFSLAGGGRYDKMIGDFIDSGKEFPATGLAFGLEPILETMKIEKKIELSKSTAQVYLIPIGTLKESLDIAENLRSEGINTDVDIMGRGISKNLNYANSLGIPFVIFIGEDELKSKMFKLKDMKSGKEETLSKEEIIKNLSQ